MFIDKDRIKHYEAKVGEQKINELVSRVRQTIEFDNNYSVPDFDTDAANQLYDILLAWNDVSLRQIKHLHVTTTGSLASLPFSLLLRKPIKANADAYGRADWLIKHMAITETPTLTAWFSLRESKAKTKGKEFIAWALPLKEGEVLPTTVIEAGDVARALGADHTKTVIKGSQATLNDVLERSRTGELAKKSVVMFATHGIAPGDNPDSTQPALKMYSENGQDGFLKLEHVMGLQLSADWVILSACNTDAADKLGGAPYSGLARGFFFSGADGLLLTHWSVESTSASKITAGTMEEYYKDPKKGHSEALRKVSLKFISGKIDLEDQNTAKLWQHPAYWAPFSVVGGR